MTVNIKYCGGCKPRYDREAMVGRMKSSFSEMSFISEANADADAMVVLCGCPSACTDLSDSYGTYGRFVIWSESAYGRLTEFLKNIDKNLAEQSS